MPVIMGAGSLWSRVPMPVRIAFAIVLIELAIFEAAGALHGSHSSLRSIWNFLRVPGDDSWRPMWTAYDWVMQGHRDSLYQWLLIDRHVKFQYPPSSLLPLALGRALGIDIGRHPHDAAFVLSLLFLLAQLAASAGLALETARRLGWHRGEPVAQGALALLAMLVCATFYPTVRAAELGQIQTWLNSWFVIAAYCWVRDRRMAAGALIGAICLFKPQFGLFLVWALLRRQWSFAIGWAAVCGAGGLAAIICFGFGNCLDYLGALSYLSRHGESYEANQSFNGLLNRLLVDPGGTLVWRPDAFPPFDPFVYGATVLSSLLLVAGALVYGQRWRSLPLVDFLGAGLAFTIASPIAWEHHYGALPALFVVLGLAIDVSAEGRARPWRWLGLFAAYSLTSHYVPLSFTPPAGLMSLAYSCLFFGALILYLMIYPVAIRTGEGPPVRPAAA